MPEPRLFVPTKYIPLPVDAVVPAKYIPLPVEAVVPARYIPLPDSFFFVFLFAPVPWSSSGTLNGLLELFSSLGGMNSFRGTDRITSKSL